MFKNATDFGGYWIKGIKNFKGRGGEPLFQCTVYKDNKKIGLFSEGSGGGCQASLDCPQKEDRAALCDFAKKYEGKEAWGESYHTFLASIVEEIDKQKSYKRKCRTKTLFTTPDCKENQYRDLNLKYEGNEAKVKAYLDKNYPKGYKIINELLP